MISMGSSLKKIRGKTPNVISHWWWRFSCSVVSDSVTPRTAAHQAPLFTGFSRQEHWSELPFPPPGDLLDPGIELLYPALASGFFITESPEKPPI